MEALYEVQAAEFLGYRRMIDFRRALRRGKIPAPDRLLGGDPVWSRSRLEAWLLGDDRAGSVAIETRELIERADRGTY